MRTSTGLFTGILGSFAVSCYVLVLIPQMQLGNLKEFVDEEAGDRYPVVNTRPGREIYIREGCYYCHSQQVRDSQNGADVERGWGVRRTVARDYIFEKPPLLGNSRLGPDLSNVGSPTWRNEPEGDIRKPAKRDAQWHLRHLYNPKLIITESNMPAYPWLFEEKPIGSGVSKEAVEVNHEKGTQIVPKNEAKQLVEYLLSLDRSRSLPEAKVTALAAPAQP
jgi:cytochrome c oxidase cbb3-type subunit 2